MARAQLNTGDCKLSKNLVKGGDVKSKKEV